MREINSLREPAGLGPFPSLAKHDGVRFKSCIRKQFDGVPELDLTSGSNPPFFLLFCSVFVFFNSCAQGPEQDLPVGFPEAGR